MLANPVTVRLPVATVPAMLASPLLLMFPPVIFPVALIVVAARKLLAEILLAVILPVVVKLTPVAAPIFGVVRLAPALTIISPVLLNAVVLLSTLAEITVPDTSIPFPAV